MMRPDLTANPTDPALIRWLNEQLPSWAHLSIHNQDRFDVRYKIETDISLMTAYLVVLPVLMSQDDVAKIVESAYLCMWSNARSFDDQKLIAALERNEEFQRYKRKWDEEKECGAG